MNTMKILLVEDAEEQRDAFESSVKVFNNKHDLTVDYEIAKNIEEALDKIGGSYDGAIIDLRLGDDEEGGNKIVRQLGDSFTRLPIVFVTAFVDSVGEHPSIICKRSRETASYESDLLLLQKFWNTGLTRIMGGRGKIEETLSSVFLRHLLPRIDTWMSYGQQDSQRTEKALLRHTLNHLLQLLDDDGDDFFPEEVYLAPPLTEEIRTGSIVQREEDEKWFVIMNPACDLVIRNGCRNTDRILLVEIDPITMVFPWIQDTNLSKSNLSNKRKNKLQGAFRNNRSYEHWLPKTDFFEGGFLNFRKLLTLETEEFCKQFPTHPTIQLSPSFVKDIVARFSAYYARQGQPDIDFDSSLGNLTTQDGNSQ